MKRFLIVACVACAGSGDGPRPTSPPPPPPPSTITTPAPAVPTDAADPGPALLPRAATRTATALTAERWTFAESTLRPVFDRIDSSMNLPSQVFVSPDGAHLVVVDNQRDFEVRSPAKTTFAPRPPLAWPYARVSPRGDHVALVEESSQRDWYLASNLSVLRFSDHAIVATLPGGTDPHWVGDTLAFRVGDQAWRLDLPATEATAVGPPQATHGCPNAALRGYTRVDESMCPGGRYSRVLAVDPAVTTWLVVDDGGVHETALRVVDLASGRDRVLADRASHGFPLYVTVSPGGTRYCLTPKTAAGYQLHCGRFPAADDQVKLLDLGNDRLPSVDWLDDDRLLIARVGIVDLASGKQIELAADLNDATSFDGTLGPRYVIADMGWVFLLDLETRTSTRLDDGTQRVFAKATAAGRFWVTHMDRKSLSMELFELRLVPR